jgi:phosphoesterase RecJ-like protein
LDYEKQTSEANAAIEDAGLIFCLDFNTLVRTKRMEEKLGKAKEKLILIDHHAEPQTEKFSYGISDISQKFYLRNGVRPDRGFGQPG